MGRDARWQGLPAAPLVSLRQTRASVSAREGGLKARLSAVIASGLRVTFSVRESLQRLWSHSSLSARLQTALPASAVVLGRTRVYGTANITFGEGTLLYPDLHLETQDKACIRIGSGVVLSSGVHLVAMAGITIGDGTMIGEYTSVRDANHQRTAGANLRESGHTARPISIGSQVWIGRGVAILAGITIGDGATVGANAVVTRDVPAGAVVGGVPAKPLMYRALPVSMP